MTTLHQHLPVAQGHLDKVEDRLVVIDHQNTSSVQLRILRLPDRRLRLDRLCPSVWQGDDKLRAACGPITHFNRTVVVANDRQTNTQSQTRTLTRTLGREERLKDVGQQLVFDSGAIILKGSPNFSKCAARADPDGAAFLDFTNSLLGV